MISDIQKEIIKNQIGREPRGCVSVAYEQNGVPVVLQMRSMVDGEPFPTLFWLSSQDLHLQIARWETDGWVKRLEDRIAEDESFRQAYAECHERYVQRRWALMADEDYGEIIQRGFTDLFNRYGIGGLSRWDKVRCLHMHVADYLCTPAGDEPNVIGALLDEAFDIKGLTLKL